MVAFRLMESFKWLEPAPFSRYVDIFASFLTSKSFPLFFAYLLLVSQCRKWRKIHPQPMDLKVVMIVYNVVVSLVNVYCFAGFAERLLNAESLFERKFDTKLSDVYFVYWATKAVELLDTAFMTLRHKFRQISPLHVYHHASMLLLSDLGYTRYAWAAFAMPLMLNALVHVFLYMYYAATAAGLDLGHWKRRLTELQIAQFLIDLVHGAVGFFRHDFCVWSIAYGISMLYLFSSFYYNAYLKKSKSS